MDKNAKIYVAGHKGLVGSAICRVLKKKGYENQVFRTHQELELTDQKAVADFFEKEQPDYVFLAAAKVGGILANNTYRADFIYDNIQVQSNVIHQSFKCGVTKLLFLGSTCIYPKECPQPMKEEYLLTSPLEYTNEPYATAKIAGIKMCESYNLQYGTNFLSVMPTNLYGPGDNFDLEKSHVLPAMLRKMHLARLLEQNQWDEVLVDLKVDSIETARQILDKFGISAGSVEIWGTGKPMREFLWSEDMADACVFVMENVDFKDLTNGMKEIRNTHINIGSGKEISIKDLALAVKNVVGFQGNLMFNTDKPDGTLRKLTDVSKLEALGWKYCTSLNRGLGMLYDWYLGQQIHLR
ncbi:GDP-L-fucose synthase family protein [Desulfobacter latus]|uniref:GDP-L-fucose synthase n=1 Tax=Desulfobacter latus TaxID=2292 RepID=A0A850T3X0_9BACT|nr:GDP-L-fucose synthase [Desulfobacter latus]NWH05781.1 GDP-L-fucose synthase [Desulfobacter latus]